MNSYRISQVPSLLTILDIECSCCHISMNSGEEAVEIILFGAKKYSVCLRCHQAVGEKMAKDRNYRRRWMRLSRRLAERVCKSTEDCKKG